MKKVYLIQSNINDSAFFEARVKNLGDWVKYFSDNYIVASELTATKIYEYLVDGYENENKNKSIFIVEIDTINYYGWMNTKIWDFLKKYKNQNK
ncbi:MULTISPECIES: hypothetical protein [Chryseobacterium]|uniref:hypothetical protein n=1 Tax=Chryseobacterium TaxID=59732 RepID=UPI0028A23564|nr:hypothetical protein [Chryseobacterium sp.]